MNIAEKVLWGSQELDRKRQAINQIVKMMLDSVDKDKNPYKEPVPEKIIFKPPWWAFKRRMSGWVWHLYNVSGKIFVICVHQEGDEKLIELLRNYALYQSDTKQMEVQWVPDVYFALPTLVEGMRKNFRGVYSNLLPFLKAKGK